jgi:hypothetical protein
MDLPYFMPLSVVSYDKRIVDKRHLQIISDTSTGTTMLNPATPWTM